MVVDMTEKNNLYILTINPGSTSTKIAIYEDSKAIFEEEIMHDPEVVMSFKKRDEDYRFRKETILGLLSEKGFDINKFSAVVGRGGFVQPIEGGVYEVNRKMLDDLEHRAPYEHPSNLGAPLAYEIASGIGVKAYTVDPVVVDEMSDLARVSGYPDIIRKSVLHALNIRAVARIAAEKHLKKKHSDVNLIVIHMGGGISVTAHFRGKMVDVNNAFLGMGPFTPQRVGALPTGELIKLCYSGKFTQKELEAELVKNAGLRGYLGTNDAIEIEKMIENGNELARLIYEALAYQISKEVGAMATVLKGNVDAIIFTGGLSRSDMLMRWIKERVSFIADVIVIPGQKEMDAMAESVLRILKGEEEAKEYIPKEILDPMKKYGKQEV